MDKIVIINGSCNPKSRTHLLAQKISLFFEGKFIVKYFDLRYVDVPRCGNILSDDEKIFVESINNEVELANGVIICTPIYGQHMTGILKDFLDHLYSLKGKPVLCCEMLGTDKSCLAIQNVTNYLLFGHNTFVFPKFLMINESDFNDEAQLSLKTEARLQKLLSNFAVFVKKISSERIDL